MTGYRRSASSNKLLPASGRHSRQSLARAAMDGKVSYGAADTSNNAPAASAPDHKHTGQPLGELDTSSPLRLMRQDSVLRKTVKLYFERWLPGAEEKYHSLSIMPRMVQSLLLCPPVTSITCPSCASLQSLVFCLLLCAVF